MGVPDVIQDQFREVTERRGIIFWWGLASIETAQDLCGAMRKNNIDSYTAARALLSVIDRIGLSREEVFLQPLLEEIDESMDGAEMEGQFETYLRSLQ